MMRFAWGAAFISSLCAVICMVWALDKHWYAEELSQQVAQLHVKASQEHQARTKLQLQNQRLKQRLQEYQELEKLRVIAKNTNQAQRLGINNGVHIMLEPHGGLRYTSQ